MDIRVGRPRATLGAYEIPKIIKAPPRSVFSHAKKPIDELSVRRICESDEVALRFDENIMKAPRGVDITNKGRIAFSNAGGGARYSSLPSVQASNPYKIQVVRPPVVAPVELLPLSKQKRGNTQVNARIQNVAASMDANHKPKDAKALFKAIHEKLATGIIVPNMSFNIDKASRNFDQSALDNAVRTDAEMFHVDLTARSSRSDLGFDKAQRTLLDPASIKDYVDKISAMANLSNLNYAQQLTNLSSQDKELTRAIVQDKLGVVDLVPNLGMSSGQSNTNRLSKSVIDGLIQEKMGPDFISTTISQPIFQRNARTDVSHFISKNQGLAEAIQSKISLKKGSRIRPDEWRLKDKTLEIDNVNANMSIGGSAKSSTSDATTNFSVRQTKNKHVPHFSAMPASNRPDKIDRDYKEPTKAKPKLHVQNYSSRYI